MMGNALGALLRPTIAYHSGGNSPQSKNLMYIVKNKKTNKQANNNKTTKNHSALDGRTALKDKIKISGES